MIVIKISSYYKYSYEILFRRWGKRRWLQYKTVEFGIYHDKIENAAYSHSRILPNLPGIFKQFNNQQPLI